MKYGVFMVSIAVAYAIPSEASELSLGQSAFLTSLNLPVGIGRVEDDEIEEGTYSADAAWVLLLLRDELNAIALLPNHFFCIASRTSAPTPGE